MRKSFKYRAYLTNGQRRILERQLEACRWTYNEVLAERKQAYEERGETLRLYDTGDASGLEAGAARLEARP